MIIDIEYYDSDEYIADCYSKFLEETDDDYNLIDEEF